MGVLNFHSFSAWPSWTYVGNISGLCSNSVWFIVLVPQVFKNARRRSVEGVSFLWALANFTASLTNFFFVFNHDPSMPLYMRISAVYMPCLEITILFQFLLWARVSFTRKRAILVGCICLWGTIITLCAKDAAKVNWLAIVLWSVETYPQIVLNMQRRSVSGLSFFSTVMTLAGKIFDFIAVYTLNMPLQYVVLAYFSSSSAYISGSQFFWYGWDPLLPPQEYIQSFIKTLRRFCRFCRSPQAVNSKGSTARRKHHKRAAMSGEVDESHDSSHDNRSCNNDTTEKDDCPPSEVEEEAVEEETHTLIVPHRDIKTPQREHRHIVHQSALEHFRHMPMKRQLPFLHTLIMISTFSVCFFFKVKYYAAGGPFCSFAVLLLSYLYRSSKDKNRPQRKCAEFAE